MAINIYKMNNNIDHEQKSSKSYQEFEGVGIIKNFNKRKRVPGEPPRKEPSKFQKLLKKLLRKFEQLVEFIKKYS